MSSVPPAADARQEAPERITPEQIAELRRREEEATPGPWYASFPGVRTMSHSEISQIAAGRRFPMMSIGDIRGLESVAYTYPDRSSCDYEWENCYGEKIGVNKNSDANAAFIAMSRNALPSLLDEIERLQGELARLQAAEQAGYQVKADFHAAALADHIAAHHEGDFDLCRRTACRCYRDADAAYWVALKPAFTPRQAPAEGKGEGG